MAEFSERLVQLSNRTVSLLMSIALSIASVGVFLITLDRANEGYGEARLAALLIGGTVSFIMALTGVVSAFRFMELTSPTEALGLPAGSVQAVMALALILLFFIMAVFLYGDLSSPSTTQATMTEEQVTQVNGADIVSMQPNEGDPSLIDVELARERGAAEDIARQLVTTVATLVVAIASFYFGAKTVQQVTQGSTR